MTTVEEPSRQGGRATGAAAPAPPDTELPPPAAPSRSWRPHPLSVLVLVLVLVVVGVAAWAAAEANHGTERSLLHLQARQVATALEVALPTVQSELVAADEAGMGPSGVAQFKGFMATQLRPKGSFVSGSLWQVGTGPPAPLVVVGTRPELLSSGRADAFFAGVHPNRTLYVVGLLSGSEPRLGYAEDLPGSSGRLVVYTESPLPPSRRAVIKPSSSFADLNFALYLGHTTDPRDLLESTVPLPITAEHATITVPFGDSAITLVATQDRSLSGSLSSRLPWLIAVFGLFLALLSALVAEGLIRRKETAEALADENRRLFRQQRDIAQTLQHALLPEQLPALPGLESAVRYLPGAQGMDIGGDWYDIVRLDDDRCFFVIGDVSGRGLPAATTMASLRYAIRAFASQGDTPDQVLEKVGGLVAIDREGQFATVLCGRLDLAARTVSLANAGHFPPLLVDGDEARYLGTPLGPPIGVSVSQRPGVTTVPLPASGTLLAFTDGLVERRGEHLDVGLERLRLAALGDRGTVDDLLLRLVGVLTPAGSDDDVAVLGLRWRR